MKKESTRLSTTTTREKVKMGTMVASTVEARWRDNLLILRPRRKTFYGDKVNNNR